MPRRRNRLIFILIAAALLAQVALGFRYTGKDYCGIVGNRVKTFAPTSMVLLRYGLPDERQADRRSQHLSYTYRDMKLFGREAEITFDMAKFRVYQITVTLEEGAEELYPTALESVRQAYAGKRGFQFEEREDGCAMDTTVGPPWYHADLRLDDGSLAITIIEQR